MIKTLIVSLGLLLGGTLFAASGNLEIYWIDADGGAATLIVAPSGKSLLIDTANRRDDDSDAKRILAAAKTAGLTKIDILLTTHFHGDHIGGMPALASMIPIAHYMDHGPSVELDRPRVAAVYEAYEKLSNGKRTILKAGDKVPLEGLDITVVQSAGKCCGWRPRRAPRVIRRRRSRSTSRRSSTSVAGSTAMSCSATR
jgi:beta-lactamase superfamily II metal-dependent hydrolase